MTLTELSTQIALGEDSRHQFKPDVTNADSLAAEMAAFANSEGGTILLGVADDGSLSGLSRSDVTRLNQLIGNAASQHVRSPLMVQTENIGVGDARVVIVLTIAKGLLPYRGLGSGIKRALEYWPAIDFTDDREGCLFTATVHRKEIEGSVEPEKSSEKSSEKILALLKADSELAAREIVDALGITQRAVEKQIAKLREEGRIRRIGPAKGGHWEVAE